MQCITCENRAVFECSSCYGLMGEGLSSTLFCNECVHRVHANLDQNLPNLNHKPKRIRNESPNNKTKRFMELFAILCIETSHYVAFVRCGSSRYKGKLKSSWCFFDSMADRIGNIFTINKQQLRNNYNDFIHIFIN